MNNFGLLVVDKPVGPTSHQVVSLVRKGTGIRKVGHAGTLDPRASGVLVLCLGAATRLSEYLSCSQKQYEAVVRFGSATRTYDAEGDITYETGVAPKKSEIIAALPSFTGEIEQIPPPFSAIKVKGHKAYELARAGKIVKLEPRKVTIYRLEVGSYHPPDLSLRIECSAGTYIRSIAHDLGKQLRTGAYLAGLRRIKAGPFKLEDATPLAMLEVGLIVENWEQYVIPAIKALPDFPLIEVNAEEVNKIRNGHRIVAKENAQGLARAVGADGELVAVLKAVEDGTLWHPHKVFIG
jgi:tRNA pseudouridine55 synthase